MPARWRSLRLHGDCHAGNVLWTDDGPHFVDLDDARMGPAVQDLWMLLSGDADAQTTQLAHVLEGYEQFRDFDRRELLLIEPLRTLRLIHYSGWIARRFDDPAFPAAFPWFGTQRYWQDRILELREQVALMDEPPLAVVGTAGQLGNGAETRSRKGEVKHMAIGPQPAPNAATLSLAAALAAPLRRARRPAAGHRIRRRRAAGGVQGRIRVLAEPREPRGAGAGQRATRSASASSPQATHGVRDDDAAWTNDVALQAKFPLLAQTDDRPWAARARPRRRPPHRRAQRPHRVPGRRS